MAADSGGRCAFKHDIDFLNVPDKSSIHALSAGWVGCGHEIDTAHHRIGHLVSDSADRVSHAGGQLIRAAAGRGG
jgi:hypothetical protein